MTQASEESQRYDGETFQLVSFDNDDISGTHFSNCDFVQVTFLDNIDVVFDRCRFEGCEFTGNMYSTTFIGCSIGDNKFSNMALDDSQFLESNLENSSFLGVSMVGVSFIGCGLEKSLILDCDATLALFEACDLDGAKFDDTSFAEADLSTSWSFGTSDLEPASGDSRTVLPDDVPAPEHWLSNEPTQQSIDEAEGIPGQVPAPLRVIWREEKLVPDPRGHAEDALRNSSTLTIFRSFRTDVAVLAAQPPSNHPYKRHIDALDRALAKGVAAVNPVEIGYQIEMLKAYLPTLPEVATEATVDQVRAIVAGGVLLSMQFADWRQVVDAAAKEEHQNLDLHALSRSITELSNAIRLNSQTIDRRIAFSLETQSDDLVDTPRPGAVSQGAANSTGNVISALATRLWSITKGGAVKAGDEAVKFAVREFLTANKDNIYKLASIAPRTLGWIKDVLEDLLAS